MPAGWSVEEDGPSSTATFSDHRVYNEDGTELASLYYDRRDEITEEPGCLAAVIPSFVLEREPVPDALPAEQLSRVTNIVQIDDYQDQEGGPRTVWQVRSALQEQVQIRGWECATPSAIYLSTGGIVQIEVTEQSFSTLLEAAEYEASEEFTAVEALSRGGVAGSMNRSGPAPTTRCWNSATSLWRMITRSAWARSRRPSSGTRATMEASTPQIRSRSRMSA